MKTWTRWYPWPPLAESGGQAGEYCRVRICNKGTRTSRKRTRAISRMKGMLYLSLRTGKI
ncbi:hypothetical protein IF1G_07407 [Cordyceps javanica]|uniref:Uncharacterized protein n=1 Tax=Cordyceps javanica TaxID=43265 RepID=A0A545UW40_9HYPO|nr:hypothetical protein IF1G_07407 [Cordyceps javanica]